MFARLVAAASVKGVLRMPTSLERDEPRPALSGRMWWPWRFPFGRSPRDRTATRHKHRSSIGPTHAALWSRLRERAETLGMGPEILLNAETGFVESIRSVRRHENLWAFTVPFMSFPILLAMLIIWRIFGGIGDFGRFFSVVSASLFSQLP